MVAAVAWKLRRERRMQVDQEIMSVLTCDWTGATEIARAIGRSWQITATTLRRMAEDGKIDGKEIWRKALRHRLRRSHVYRTKAARGTPPGWLEPRVVPVSGGGNVRVVIGVGLIGRSVRMK